VSAALTLVIVVAAVLLLVRPGAAWRGGTGGVPTESGHILTALEEGLAQVEALRRQVDAGQIVPVFGERAGQIITEALARAGAPAPELEQALDDALHALFLRQVALLAARVAVRVPGSRAGAAEALEREFAAEANALLRPGSSWSLQQHREVLHAGLEGRLRRSAALMEERARGAQLQHATVGVIARLQEQMEQLQQKVQGMRGGGSPWVFSTSYRIPNTPLQFAGKYEQGRANIELNLTPDKNPTDADTSFIDGIGPASLGVSFNVGI